MKKLLLSVSLALLSAVAPASATEWLTADGSGGCITGKEFDKIHNRPDMRSPKASFEDIVEQIRKDSETKPKILSVAHAAPVLLDDGDEVQVGFFWKGDDGGYVP